MEAEVADDLPTDDGWQDEPKYDGFRCLPHRTEDAAHLMSKNQKLLGRYFTELEQAVLEDLPAGTMVDGEIVSPRGFEARAHRVAKLSAEAPCRFILFDLLALGGRAAQ